MALDVLLFLGKHQQDDGREDEHNADEEAQGEGLAEDEHADEDGRDRLHSTHNGGGRTADILDGNVHEVEAEHRGQQSQLGSTGPLLRSGEDLDLLAHDDGQDEQGDQAEQDHPERKLDGGKPCVGLVDANDVECVEERREQDQRHAHRGERGIVATTIEQSYARDGQKDGEGGGPGDALMEERRHQHGCDDGVAEEDRTGDSCVHVLETEVERGRGHGHECAQDGHADGGSEAQVKTLPLRHHPCKKQQRGNGVAPDEDRRRVDLVLVEE